jgi:hypothetical protein
MIDEWLTTQEAAKVSGYHIEDIRRLDGVRRARKMNRFIIVIIFLDPEPFFVIE